MVLGLVWCYGQGKFSFRVRFEHLVKAYFRVNLWLSPLWLCEAAHDKDDSRCG